MSENEGTTVPVPEVESEKDKHVNFIRQRHKRMFEDVREIGPGPISWKKRCNPYNLGSNSNHNSREMLDRTVSNTLNNSTTTSNYNNINNTNKLPLPSLDEAVNLLGYAPGNDSILSSELGLLLYSKGSENAKTITNKINQQVKEKEKALKNKELNQNQEKTAIKGKTSSTNNKGNNGDDKNVQANKKTTTNTTSIGSVDLPERRSSRRSQENIKTTTTNDSTIKINVNENEGDNVNANDDEDGTQNSEESNNNEDDSMDWVQCETCEKWRRLPPKNHPRYPTNLPDSWLCTMNDWDETTNTCSAPEESANAKVLTRGGKKVKIWLRRLRSNDRYMKIYTNHYAPDPTQLSMQSMQNMRRQNGHGVNDWIRCTNPNCGKWRSCLRSVNARLILSLYPDWTCWMNSWDETRASCTAPQEGTSVRSLAEVSEEDMLANDELKAEEMEESNSRNYGQQGNYGSSGTGGLPGEEDDIEYSRGVSQRGRIVRSRWTAQARRRWQG